MTNLRFALAAAALFCTAFAGFTFGKSGLPWTASSAAPPSQPAIVTAATPDTGIVAEAIPDLPEPSPVIEARLVVANPMPPQSEIAPAVAAVPVPSSRPANPDQLARTALQAADAYSRAPCDRVARAVFIVAASTYLRAQGTTPQAPEDARVHKAIKVAFEGGGISRDEFPLDVMMSARPTRANARSGCVSSAGLRP